jgi:hypothetical protein
MRFKDFIESNEEDYPLDEIISLIEKDVREEFLTAIRRAGDFAYRGTEKIIRKDIVKIKPRSNRVSKDTPMQITKKLDERFAAKFRWAPRSQGVFVTGNDMTAADYGDPYCFFPIGPYKFIWSPDIDDLFSEMEELFDNITGVYGIKTVSDEDLNRPEVRRSLDEVVKTYTNKDLVSALKSSHEIMFKCRAYYLVSFNSKLERALIK